MNLRNILIPFVAAMGTMFSLSSCDGVVSKVTQKVLSRNSMGFDYKDSDKWGKVVECDLDLSDFHSIEASGAVKVVLSQDNTCSVRVRSNEKCLEQYDIEVRRGKLNIHEKGFGKNSITKETPSVTLYISVPLLDKMEFSGGCELEMLGVISMSSDLEIEMNGAAKVKVDTLSVHNLDVELNGACDLSASSINAAEDVELEMNGAGSANVCVFCQNLSVELNGAGTATLTGECNNLKCDENGASNVDFSNLKRGTTK